VVLSILGVLLAAVHLIRRARSLRVVASLAAARQATLADRWALLEDSGVAVRVVDDGQYAGSVVVATAEKDGAIYRGLDSRELALTRGRKTELLAAAASKARSAETDAIVTLLLTTTPLVVAAAYGLVF
jgi:hypothetical protein